MKKSLWNQNMMVVGLGLLVVLMWNITTEPAEAAAGEVESYHKISEDSGDGLTLDTNDWFGYSVAGIGDLDGDGVEDIAVGASKDDDGGGDDSGAAYVLFMNTNGTVDSIHKISEDSGDGLTLDEGGYFGSSVASIGDLDGDGVEDIAVGARYDGDGNPQAGAVYVLFMNTNGTVDSIQKISETSGSGPDLDNNDLFGSSVAGIGDLDGDGVEDIAVGAYGDDDGEGNSSGAVYVLFLNTNGTVKGYEKISDTNGVPVLDENDYFGYSVDSIGDLDGDGVEDLAVGARNDDDGATNAGAVYVLSMNTNGTVKSYQKISQTNGVPELYEGDYFGVSVAGLGDLDLDGVDDLAVGAELDDDGDGDNSGAVYVLFMDTNGTVKRYQKISEDSGSGPNLNEQDRFGISVARIGDLDGDGVEDIVVGARLDDDGDGDDSGAVYVLMLKGGFRGTIFSAY